MRDSPRARGPHQGSGSASRYGIVVGWVVEVVVALEQAQPPAVVKVAAGPFQGVATRRSRTLQV